MSQDDTRKVIAKNLQEEVRQAIKHCIEDMEAARVNGEEIDISVISVLSVVLSTCAVSTGLTKEKFLHSMGQIWDGAERQLGRLDKQELDLPGLN